MWTEAEAQSSRLLLIDGHAGYDFVLDGGALEIRRHGACAQLVPIRRVARVLVRTPADRGLRAMLELVSRGVAVHFQDGQGRIAAALVPTERPPTPQVRDLVAAIETRDPRAGYREWLDLQLRHAASRILRTSPRGSIETFERALIRYAAWPVSERCFSEAWNEVRALLFAWIDAELTRRRLRTLAEALAWRECPLLRDLDRGLSIPLLWQFAPWLRKHRHHQPRERMDFFERVRPQLGPRLDSAFAALDYHLRYLGARGLLQRHTEE